MVRLKRTNHHTIDTISILLPLALFAITSFLIIAIGAGHYHSITSHRTENEKNRTVFSYLWEKFNQNDVMGSVFTADLNGISAVAMTQNVNEQIYTTYLYVYDGYLRETTVSKNTLFTPESGITITELSALEIEYCSNNLFRIIVTDTFGNKTPIYISRNAK
ncbi:MAG: DUF4860 domain-containing protein [Lachnospiraceae bacterium]|nr:DUF4860 domain-containing protein [Lachnospiraceae bacterium]